MQLSTGNLESKNPNSQQTDDSSQSEPALAVRSKQRGSAETQTGVDDAEPKRLSLAELFAESPDDADDEDHSQDSDAGKPVDSLDGLQKRLRLKPEQVYAIKVPMPNGAEPLTIGELKDRVAELVDLETRELQFEQRRVKQEGELLRAQQEMRELLAMLPPEHIKPELVEKIRKRHEETMARERKLTLEHIPEWQDENRRIEEMKGIAEMLSHYGFDESVLTSIVDHRALKFVRDAYLRDKRIRDALAKVTVVPKKGQRPSAKAAKPAARPNSPSGKPRAAVDQRSRILSLFNRSET